MSEHHDHPGEAAEGPEERRLTFGQQMAQAYGNSGAFRRDERGQIDVMHAIGGVRGLLEAVLPSIAYLTAFLITSSLGISLSIAIGLAVVASVLRFITGGQKIQAFSGAVGVLICAFFAHAGGKPIDYYVVGFWTNGAYAAGLLLSMAVRWPLLGLIYGMLRGEDTAWRGEPARRRVYQLATGVLAAMFLVRLAVQLPLFFAENLPALGISRLVMGIPLYAFCLWITWMMTRPAVVVEAAEN
ncbi:MULTISPECIES: DUF3159 domain-containing protein [Kocuria]|uniref:DUF3159 domain-containing protein n=1 Tax=Kocuria TaxID=57493 RepID=UPI0006606BD5|nr:MULTISPECIES: DUF3159 domain-containing protein [Kocuria]RUQ22734.1 DUF3159 domain-containing protein [Kocuria sp. HSID16901]